jgi:hypothetical protein
MRLSPFRTESNEMTNLLLFPILLIIYSLTTSGRQLKEFERVHNDYDFLEDLFHINIIILGSSY